MKNYFVAALLLLTLLVSCSKQEKSTDNVIGPKEIKVENGILTPEVLWSFGRLGETAISPNADKIAYTITWYSVAENKSNSDIYIMGIDGSNKKQLTKTDFYESNISWIDNETLAFTSDEDGTSQVWSKNVDNNSTKKLSNFPYDINGFSISPKGDKILFISEIKVDKSTADVYPDLPKSSGMMFEDIMYRHWDTWEDGLYSHIFVADLKEGQVTNPKDIMEGQPYDSPLKPFDGMEEISWTPDGKFIAYTCKELTGKKYSFSTNSDIFLYDIENGSKKNLTEGMPGYDKAPVFSPDGTKMAWLSMERAGFESDKDRLFILDLATGEKSYLTKNFDYSVADLHWYKDSKTLYFVVGIEATFQIYKLDLASNEIKPITQGFHDYNSFALEGDLLIGNRVSITKPAELYKVDISNGKEEELTFINKPILDQLTMPTVERRWTKSTDGKMVHSWVVLPPNFDKSKKYPAILFCTGGPQEPVSQFWSYRWNLSIMASNGYVVVAPSRRGTTTFGQAWTDQVSKDHGGQEMKDLLAAIDDVKKEPWVDPNRLGAVGASYGGETIFWMEGNHQKRFKAFIAHCGVFNAEMEYMTTDEMFFDDWENGGAPWDDRNKVAIHSFAQSPHKFIKNWDTPILVVHGGKDFRIPYTQGMAAFNVAQMLNIPSKFLFFPDENHWVLKPQNGILWQREFKAWLDKWLK